jgi:hypothetical protein
MPQIADSDVSASIETIQKYRGELQRMRSSVTERNRVQDLMRAQPDVRLWQEEGISGRCSEEIFFSQARCRDLNESLKADLSQLKIDLGIAPLLRLDREQTIRHIDEAENFLGRAAALVKPIGKTLTSVEVANLLNINQTTVTRRCKAGKFYGAKLNADGWEIPESSVPIGKQKADNNCKPKLKLAAAVVWECAKCSNTITSKSQPTGCKCGWPAYTRQRLKQEDI